VSAERLRLGPRPLLHRGVGLEGQMGRVLLALLPALAGGLVAYGAPALATASGALLGFLLAEVLMKALLGNRQRLGDGSAALSGLLLALILPPALGPLWSFAGAFAGGILGKELFGGLGRNPLNPALVGRLLLSLGAGPRLRSAHLEPFWWKDASWLSWPPAEASVQPALEAMGDAWRMLEAGLAGHDAGLSAAWAPDGDRLAGIQRAQELLETAGLGDWLWTSHAGAIGEFSLLLLLPGLAWLLAARIVDWRVPLPALAMLLPLLLLAAGGPAERWLSAAIALQGAWLALLLLVFAADPVTSPLSQSGRVIHGLLLGVAAALLLRYSDQAGGFVLALLTLNLLVPWIDRWALPRGPLR
jgi:Na+-translocating ferredoxin:NAD+ oxidoreductase subunit D